MLWSALALAAAITFVIGCSKQLPTQTDVQNKGSASSFSIDGNCQLSIGDFVWNDLNGDGVQDPGEPGIEGVAVVLLNDNGDFLAEVTTDANGFYAFRDVCPGNYKIYVKEPNCPPTKLGGTSDPNKDSNPNPTELKLGETDYSVDFGFVCTPKEECGPCKGKVTELCLKYNGNTPLDLKIGKSSKTLAFARIVQPGETFCFSGYESDGTFGTEIKVWASGQEIAKIHTSCSRPIGPGLIAGPFEVISGSSRDGGPLCPLPPPPPPGECAPCQGKLTELCMKYNGSSTIDLKVGKSIKTTVFSGLVGPGGEFCFKGWEKDGTFGKSVKFFVSGKEVTKFKAECSKSKKIGIGFRVGLFEVTSGMSKDSGPLCPIDQPPPPGDDICITRPNGLRLMYTGDGCSATSHTQDPGKVACSGDPAGAAEVRIVVSNSSTPGSGKIYFDGMVPLGGEFNMTAANAGETKLSAQSYAFVYVQGQLVQSISFHTSCSQPLHRDDQFGSLRVMGIANTAVGGIQYDSF